MKRFPVPLRSAWAVLLLVAASHAHSQLLPGALGLDPGFQSGGWVSFAAPPGSTIKALSEQPDGKLVLAGYEASAPGYRMMVLRLLPDGTPDPGFHWNFADYPGLGIHTYLNAVSIHSDGRIVVAGASMNSNPLGETALVLRMLPDGRPDTTFGVNGKGYVIRQAMGKLQGVSGLASGAIVTVSYSQGLGRFSGSGVADLSFPSSRAPIMARPIGASAFGEEGRTWLVSARDLGSVAKYLPDGGPDPSFALGAGKAVSPVPFFTLPEGASICEFSRVVPLPGGAVLLGGVAFSDSGIWLVVSRILDTGIRDQSFASDGVAAVPLPGLAYTLAGLFQQSDGSIVAMANARRLDGSTFEDIAVVRLTPEGRSAPGAGPGGYARISLKESTWARDAVAIQLRNGSLLVAGSFSSTHTADTRGVFVTKLRSHPLAVKAAAAFPEPNLDLSLPRVDFGPLTAGTALRQLVLTNTGAESLTNITLSWEDAGAGEFRIGPDRVAALNAGEELPFAITFTPGQESSLQSRKLIVGARSAGIPVQPLTLLVTGRKATRLETWRYAWFGTVEPQGNSADEADFDQDGIANLMEYFVGGNPHVPDSNPVQIFRTSSGARISCTLDSALIAETNADLEWAPSPAGPWSADGISPEYAAEESGKTLIAYQLPPATERRFYRIRLSVR